MKTINKQHIYDIIHAAIDEFNTMQEEDEQLEKKPGTILFTRPGYTEKGVLDSMGLVNLLITLDEALDNDQETVDIPFDINKILEEKEKILVNIESLVDYIYQQAQQ